MSHHVIPGTIIDFARDLTDEQIAEAIRERLSLLTEVLNEGARRGLRTTFHQEFDPARKLYVVKALEILKPL